MSKVNYRVREYNPTSAQQGSHSFFAEAVINNEATCSRILSDMKQGRTLGCATVVVFIITFIALFFLTGCTTTKVVTVPEVHTDTTYITQHQRDSIWLHDSIHVTEKGDTTRIERWHTKYIEREVHDTLYRAKHDSIPVPYPVEKIVPAELSWWQQARIHLANILLYGLLIAGIIILGKWHLKKLKP